MREEDSTWAKLRTWITREGPMVASFQSGASFSGHERNNFFINLQGEQFKNVAGIAALDDPADSRAFSTIDIDRDGWLDIALINSNKPQLELFRNGIGDKHSRNFVAFQLLGGNRSPVASDEWSNRDAIGTRVKVRLGEQEIVRELRAGEGFASQNTKLLVVGIGDAPAADQVTIDWPSGRQTEIADLAAGQLATVFENPGESGGDLPYRLEDYSAPTIEAPLVLGDRAAGTGTQLTLASLPAEDVAPQLRLYTTMATWCLPCRKEIPEFNALREQFSDGQLAMYGIPVDVEDSPEMLEEWVAELQPAYRMLKDIDNADRVAVADLVVEQLKSEGVPATVVTDAAGNLLLTQWGPPSVSKLKSLLHRIESQQGP